MTIKIGKYTLHSDSYSMWIDEEYTISKGKNKGKTDIRRIAGYSTSLKNLLSSFRRNKTMGSDAEDLEGFLEVLKTTFEDMDAINREAVEKDFKLIEHQRR